MFMSKTVRCLGSMLLTVALSGCMARGTHVSPTSFCAPAWQGAEHDPVNWLRPRSDSAPSPRDVGHMLAGTWDVLTAVTEGPANVERGRIRFVATDSATWTNCQAPCRGTDRPLVVATGMWLRDNVAFDSARLATRTSTDAGRVDARYSPVHQTLGLAPGESVLDAGSFYAVTQASDTALTGRWVDGSYLLFEVRRAGVTTTEHPQGFFCARKVSGY
jgi:hypothetical protein